MSKSAAFTDHDVVSPEQWLEARKALLQKEKQFTRLRDELAAERRQLPWVKVEKTYEFDGEDGKELLSDLFGRQSQLMIYHFMFDPDWSQGCKSCSFLADHYTRLPVHLAHRDVSFVTVSRAPLDKLLAFRDRMGWSHKWVSSFGSDFNHDFCVSFTKEQRESGEPVYNYDTMPFPISEGPGLSVFYKNQNDEIFHTYSTYARGLDILIGAYNMLDMTPKGRDEAGMTNMAWLRHHDRYDDANFVDPWAE